MYQLSHNIQTSQPHKIQTSPPHNNTNITAAQDTNIVQPHEFNTNKSQPHKIQTSQPHHIYKHHSRTTYKHQSAHNIQTSHLPTQDTNITAAHRYKSLLQHPFTIVYKHQQPQQDKHIIVGLHRRRYKHQSRTKIQTSSAALKLKRPRVPWSAEILFPGRTAWVEQDGKHRQPHRGYKSSILAAFNLSTNITFRTRSYTFYCTRNSSAKTEIRKNKISSIRYLEAPSLRRRVQIQCVMLRIWPDFHVIAYLVTWHS